MLIDFKEIVSKYNLNIRGVIAVGAHYAEEHDIYVGLGINKIIYIESCNDAYEKMVDKLSERYGYPNFHGIFKLSRTDKILFKDGTDGEIVCFQIACGETNSHNTMYVSDNNQGQSNSLLKPGLHINQHPEVVFTKFENVIVAPLDEIPFKREDYNLLVMDVQGAEGLVLKGATETLKHIDIIYTEVNRDYTYENNMLIDEMDEYLANFGFARVKTYWPSPNWSWGDSIYIKEPLLSIH
jgi:FkbM family methyltransferase